MLRSLFLLLCLKQHDPDALAFLHGLLVFAFQPGRDGESEERRAAVGHADGAGDFLEVRGGRMNPAGPRGRQRVAGGRRA